MMGAEQVTIILVSYNSKSVIGTALSSIPAGIPTFVVDNASSDGTPDYIRENFPFVEVISNEKNIGFGPANNVALERVSTPFALLMNPDACFTDPSTIDDLLSATERYSEAAIFAPAIMQGDGLAQCTLFAPLVARRQINRSFPFSFADVQGDTCAFSLSGAALLLRMCAFEGEPYYFDPNIFMYFEDDDICMSANERGYSTVLIPSVSIMHLVGQSSPPSVKVEAFKLRHKTFSQLYVLSKYRMKRVALKKAIKTLVRSALSTLLYSIGFRYEKVLMSLSRVRGAAQYLMFYLKG